MCAEFFDHGFQGRANSNMGGIVPQESDGAGIIQEHEELRGTYHPKNQYPQVLNDLLNHRVHSPANHKPP